jgi:hypothetical protein
MVSSNFNALDCSRTATKPSGRSHVQSDFVTSSLLRRIPSGCIAVTELEFVPKMHRHIKHNIVTHHKLLVLNQRFLSLPYSQIVPVIKTFNKFQWSACQQRSLRSNPARGECDVTRLLTKARICAFCGETTGASIFAQHVRTACFAFQTIRAIDRACCATDSSAKD